MPLGAFVPGSLNVCQHHKIGWQDITSHDVILVRTRDHHKDDNVQPAYAPFLYLIEFVRFPEEGDPSLSDADCIRCKDVVTT